MTLSLDLDLIVLDWEPGDDVLLSLETAALAVENLRSMAASCLSWAMSGGERSRARPLSLDVEVDAVCAGGKPLVRVRVPRVAGRPVRLMPAAAMSLAAVVEEAAAIAERHVRWAEQREPRPLSGE